MSSENVELCFSLFDKEGTGSISKDAAATALRTLGKAPSTEELEVRVCECVCVDGCGCGW